MMAVITYLVALPLAVSTLGSILRIRDDADPAEVFVSTTWRAVLALVLVWLTDQAVATVAAYVTVAILQFAAFYAIRAFPLRR